MNKKLKCALLLGLVIAVIFVAFYLIPLSQQSIAEKQFENTADNILNSLKESGFSEAHYRSENRNIEYIDIYFDETNTDSLNFSNDILTLNLDEESDITKILDSILSILDNNFIKGDGKIIIQKLLNDREIDYSGYVHSGDICYKDYRFIEMLPIDNLDEPVENIVIMHK